MSYRVSRRLALVLAAVGALVVSGLPAARAEMAEAAAPALADASVDRAKLFEAVVETIDRGFADPELLKTLDWLGRARAVRSSVLAAPTTEDAVARINDLIAELKTSHTGLYTPDDYRYYITLDILNGAAATRDLIFERFWGTGPYFPGIGVFTADLDGRHFIDGVLEGSPADKAGLKYGDEILAVDGQPFSPIAAFRGRIGANAKLMVRRVRDAEPMRFAVPVIPIVPSVAFSDATQASARVIEKNGRRIGYVHLWSISETESLRSALVALRGRDAAEPDKAGPPLDALVVDIRGRVGGYAGVAGRMLDMIGTAPRPYWGRLRIIDKVGDRHFVDGLAARSGSPRLFEGRSALLIDHQTRSAGEIMAFGYKHSRFGPVFGTTTAGAVSSGAPFGMPGGLMLYVAQNGLELDGKSLEGVGVEPDYRVERPLAHAHGADPVLEAAVEFLAQ
jgi:carboxyl-terminal processing protease